MRTRTTTTPFRHTENNDKEPEEDDGENAERVEYEPTLEEDLYNSPLPKNSFRIDRFTIDGANHNAATTVSMV